MLLWEDNTVMDVLDETDFVVTDGTRKNVLQSRILEKM